MILRLLAAIADRVLATPPTTWSSASYGLGPPDSRWGGESHAPAPMPDVRPRPGVTRLPRSTSP